jgi:hypothetical protein
VTAASGRRNARTSGIMSDVWLQRVVGSGETVPHADRPAGESALVHDLPHLAAAEAKARGDVERHLVTPVAQRWTRITRRSTVS